MEAWAPLFTPALAGEIVFTIQPGRGKTLGWFCGNRWQRTDNGKTLAEINICADQLAGGLLEVADTVIHELTHYANWELGIKDCSASQYHKRSFKEMAESVGLLCTPWRKSHGWAQTQLSASARDRIEGLCIDPDIFALFRPRTESRRTERTQPKLRRWHCGNRTGLCGPVWRAAGKELVAICRACGEPFVAG